MKIAIITDDEKTISQHFGRAAKYAVYSVEDNKLTNLEIRRKTGHNDFVKLEEHKEHKHHDDPRGHGFGDHSNDKHQKMFESIKDCDVLIVRGMGRGAYQGLEKFGIKPIVTNIEGIEMAAKAVVNGTIVNYKEKLH